MTLFRCTASGVLPSGEDWSFRMHFSSGLTTGTVETDFNAQMLIAWSTGTNPYKIFVPAGTTLAETKTERLQVVTRSRWPPQLLRWRAPTRTAPSRTRTPSWSR
jgi:hypothetical protein